MLFWSHFSNEGMKKRGRRSCFQAFSQGSWGAKREREEEEEVKVELEIERGAIISPVSQSVLAVAKRVLRRSRES